MKRLYFLASLATALLSLRAAAGQIADAGVAPESGRRAFVVRELSVPFRLSGGGSLERTIPAGTVVKFFEATGPVVGYDDTGMFQVDRGDLAFLTSDLDECIQQLRTDDTFTQAFAAGSYLLNVNLSRARAYFREALRLKPDSSHAQLGIALAQSSPAEKRRLLNAVSDEVIEIRLLAETHLARLDGDIVSLRKISKHAWAPALAFQELLAHQLLHSPQSATEQELMFLVSNLMEFGGTPRSFNLQAMLLRSDAVQGWLSDQDRA